jgi:F-type H+-transporting ATPase subunit a
LSTKGKLVVLGVVALVLIVVGRLFFGVRLPEIVVPAEPVGSFFGLFPLTNTIVAAWFTIIVLLIISWAATRNLQLVPRGMQNLVEAVLEAFLQPVEAVAGPRMARRLLPFVFTIFAFVLVSNWMGLLPGYGSIVQVQRGHAHDEILPTVDLGFTKLAIYGIGSTPAADEHADPAHPPEPGPGQVLGTPVPFLRGATTDINMTLAIALVAMAFVEYMGFKTLGLTGYGGKFINVREFRRRGAFMGVIFFFVGLLEIVAELARIVSFTFRLFGNIFAGEVLLVVIGFLIPWVATVPFLGLELFVGLIQAFVFAMLTVVFTSTAMISHGDHDEHHEAAGHHEVAGQPAAAAGHGHH